MNALIVDTSVLVDFLRRPDKENSIYFKLVEQGISLTVSIVTHSELYSGKSVWENAQAQEELEKLFSGITYFHLKRKSQNSQVS